MPAASPVANYQSSQQQQQTSARMVGYGAASPSTTAMEVNSVPRVRCSPGNSRHLPENTRRSSSRDRRARSSQQSGGGHHGFPSRQSATNAPSTSNIQANGHFGSAPPQQSSVSASRLRGSTPEADVQPTYPPPAVTAESPPPSENAQRRPAYLLHRDLVIGKGSYGQVCIASRGEPEGHSSGRTGRRKKFACKCVMLRNDPKYIAKLQEEVNVLRELRGHDNVIYLHDVFCVDNELFIITELGRGGDLFHLLTTHPKHGVTESYAGTFFKKKKSDSPTQF